MPSVFKTKKSITSNKFFEIGNVPPIYDNGMDPNKNGNKSLKFKFPAFI